MSFNAEELKKAGVASLASPGDNPEAKVIASMLLIMLAFVLLKRCLSYTFATA